MDRIRINIEREVTMELPLHENTFKELKTLLLLANNKDNIIYDEREMYKVVVEKKNFKEFHSHYHQYFKQNEYPIYIRKYYSNDSHLHFDMKQMQSIINNSMVYQSDILPLTYKTSMEIIPPIDEIGYLIKYIDADDIENINLLVRRWYIIINGLRFAIYAEQTINNIWLYKCTIELEFISLLSPPPPSSTRHAIQQFEQKLKDTETVQNYLHLAYIRYQASSNIHEYLQDCNRVVLPRKFTINRRQPKPKYFAFKIDGNRQLGILTPNELIIPFDVNHTQNFRHVFQNQFTYIVYVEVCTNGSYVLIDILNGLLFNQKIWFINRL